MNVYTLHIIVQRGTQTFDVCPLPCIHYTVWPRKYCLITWHHQMSHSRGSASGNFSSYHTSFSLLASWLHSVRTISRVQNVFVRYRQRRSRKIIRFWWHQERQCGQQVALQNHCTYFGRNLHNHVHAASMYFVIKVITLVKQPFILTKYILNRPKKKRIMLHHQQP